MQSIDDHGDLINNAIEVKSVRQDRAKLDHQEDSLVSALQAIGSALTRAVSMGHDKISSAIISRQDKLSAVLQTGQYSISTAVLGASNSIGDVAGAKKVGWTNCFFNDVFQDAQSDNTKSIDQLAAALSSAVTVGDQNVRTSY